MTEKYTILHKEDIMLRHCYCSKMFLFFCENNRRTQKSTVFKYLCILNKDIPSKCIAVK